MYVTVVTLYVGCWDQDLGDDDFMGRWSSPALSSFGSAAQQDVAATLQDIKHGVIHLQIEYRG